MRRKMQAINEKVQYTHIPAKLPDYYRTLKDGSIVEITKSEYKASMRKDFTIKSHKIESCGHKFVQGEEPRHRNCQRCWFTFFQVNGQFTKEVDEEYRKSGKAVLVQLRGTKFVQNFEMFMSTLAKWKQESEAISKDQEAECETL